MTSTVIKIVITLFMIFLTPVHGYGFKLFAKDYKSKFLKLPRSIYVYLPPGINLNSKATYPVIFFHDGQNLYDPERSIFGQTWELEKTLNSLIQKKKIPEVIVVGIDNTEDRTFEYTFSKDKDEKDGGGAGEYLKFITLELIPLVEKFLPVSTVDRAMIGSSMGGLVSLYAAITKPEIFNRVAALSPSLWWDQLKILTLFSQTTSMSSVLYIDSGTEGGERPKDINRLEKIILAHQHTVKLKTFIEPGAVHDEAAWAERIPNVLIYLYADKMGPLPNAFQGRRL